MNPNHKELISQAQLLRQQIQEARENAKLLQPAFLRRNMKLVATRRLPPPNQVYLSAQPTTK